MPPLAIHTVIAKQMAERLNTPTLDQQRGNLYLGSTAPDIRVITRWDRQRTHYFDIHNFGEQSSARAFLDTNPTLANAAPLPPKTRAFLAGYLSHLVVDEGWISTVYRPFFGERSELGGTLRANVMDRALQFSLDADVRGNRDLMAHVLAAVTSADLDMQIDFLDRETIGKWHEIISDYVQSEPNWERFRARARQRHLSQKRIEEVMEASVAASVAVVKDYLSCE
jgi:Zinc dependent phospholipase C